MQIGRGALAKNAQQSLDTTSLELLGDIQHLQRRHEASLDNRT